MNIKSLLKKRKYMFTLVVISIVILQLLNKITVPFVAYSYILVDFKKAKESISRLSEIHYIEKTDHIKDINEVRDVHEIKFDAVSFQYNKKLVLQNFNINSIFVFINST